MGTQSEFSVIDNVIINQGISTVEPVVFLAATAA